MSDVRRAAMLAALRLTVRGGLAGVWVRGRLPVGPVVWAASHHSWWDPFIAAELLAGMDRRMVLLADVANVRQYRFARRIGVVGTDELRTVLAAVRGGAVLIIYPESKLLPAGTLQGRTDLGEDAYHGPCPAKGDPPHRYVFTVYALNVEKLPVPADSSGAMVTSTVQDHLLGKAVFVAHYGR